MRENAIFLESFWFFAQNYGKNKDYYTYMVALVGVLVAKPPKLDKLSRTLSKKCDQIAIFNHLFKNVKRFSRKFKNIWKFYWTRGFVEACAFLRCFPKFSSCLLHFSSKCGAGTRIISTKSMTDCIREFDVRAPRTPWT